MIVKRARILGYCMGVRKAVDKVLSVSEEAEQIKNASFEAIKPKVFTFGPLIHNPATMQYLKTRGVNAIDTKTFTGTERLDNSKVVIRAHGVAPQIKEQLKTGGAEVIDATCPKVVSSQKRAQKYAKDALVILAGDRDHGELVGIAGYAMMEEGAACLVVQNAEEARTVELKGLKEKNGKAVLIAQTTIKKSEYDEIAEILKMRIPGLLVLNTICSATFDRQGALKELAEEVESILVIGGKNSANTRRLLNTALELEKPAWLIEDASQIPEELFFYNSVGITAGASTPDFIIEEVEEVLNNS
ncbi:MAG: 4-hydroxy-3-methylbut-2-enyl diphosphate reductase [Treponema sp.]|nr:MAG: 4-hydroxy-3-methylbut-2-enyl diphosphate reductase [Treponema sp.]